VVEPKSYITIQQNKLKGPFGIGVVVIAIIVFYMAGGLTKPLQGLIPVGFLAVIIYCWHRYLTYPHYVYIEHRTLIWYLGGDNEERIEISDIASISMNGEVITQKGGRHQLPRPTQEWFPFYLHLHKNYPRLMPIEPTAS
jgi:hypothetical protein